MVPQHRRERRRIGTSEHGIVRWRAKAKSEVWGLDFVSDRTADGLSLRMLVVLGTWTPVKPS